MTSIMRAIIAIFFVSFSNIVVAQDTVRPIEIMVQDEKGEALAFTMITMVQTKAREGYSPPEQSYFTDANGQVQIEGKNPPLSLRARKIGFTDGALDITSAAKKITITMLRETDETARAEQIPANVWADQLDLGSADFKEHFRLQCSFCHQQGSPIVRLDRSEEEWQKIIDRMLRYGSRLESGAQEKLPALLRAEHQRLSENPDLITEGRAWGEELVGAQITEWPLGDGSSQLHDVLLSKDGLVYAGDNLQDNLIELNPKTGRTKTHKIPRRKKDKLGGNIGGRLKNYPGVGTYVGLHSLAESKTDGHIFMTGSDSSRLVEFAPETGKFILYDIKKGFYPHTIRLDHQDRVWFTMAVSNQVAMFDRNTKAFKFYKLPARSFKEAVTIKALPLIMTLSKFGLKTHKFAVDKQASGLPMPYGIDISPDGGVWFTRLHGNDIGHIDPKTGHVKMIKTPFVGPRRLRTDANGNVWITVFASGRLAKYDPKAEKFTLYDLPTLPLGSDTPYSLAVDHARHQVWVNGTASDTMMRYDIKSGDWAVYPLPRQRSFTRDVSIAKDGSVFTSNGSFPAWHIEDGQPTVIRIVPNDVDLAQELVSAE